MRCIVPHSGGSGKAGGGGCNVNRAGKHATFACQAALFTFQLPARAVSRISKNIRLLLLLTVAHPAEVDPNNENLQVPGRSRLPG